MAEGGTGHEPPDETPESESHAIHRSTSGMLTSSPGR